MRSNEFPVVRHLTANAAKGKYPEGFSDGVSITVIKTTQTAQPYRLLRGAGSPLAIGERLELISDSSRRSMGWFTVVGSVVPDTGETVGEVPDRSLPMVHMK